MIKILGHSIALLVCGVALSACQSTQHMVDTIRLKQAKNSTTGQANVTIYCSGTEDCQFERVDNLKIVDPVSRRVNHEAIKRGYVRLQASSSSQPNALYLTIPAKQQEVVVRFYPISQDRAETIHVIHKFVANQKYTFKMYRDRSKHAGSLLNVSVPDPLCVDLQQGQRTIRRFCRPYDALTGLGEFVEQKI